MHRKWTVSAIFCAITASCQPLCGFDCAQIRQLTDHYLGLHYSITTFDDNLSNRTLERFIQALDPSKLYFLRSDIQNFTETYACALDNMIQNEDCSGLNAILLTYSQRYRTQQDNIKALIDAEHDFSLDEYYESDPKKRTYASDATDLQERWRKRIKLELLQLTERSNTIDKARKQLKEHYMQNANHLSKLNGTELASIFLSAFASSLDPHSKYFSPEEFEDFHSSTGGSRVSGFTCRIRIQPSSFGSPVAKTIGIIHLPSFYSDFAGSQHSSDPPESTKKDLKQLIQRLKTDGESLDGLIIDLRSNAGGSLEEAIKIIGLFIQSGPVVQIRSIKGTTQILKNNDSTQLYAGPLTLLMNRQSASSSEILAGAIKDYRRGIIVGGSHSFGKGTVQTIENINQGQLGAIKVTIHQFFLPSGYSTQLKGVASDIILPDLNDTLAMGEEFYENPLPWSCIEPLTVDSTDLVTPYLEALRAASRGRVSTNEHFQKIISKVNAYHQTAAHRSLISLRSTETTSNSGDHPNSPHTENSLQSDNQQVSGTNAFENSSETITKLVNDPELFETLAITADYIQLLNDKPPGTIALP